IRPDIQILRPGLVYEDKNIKVFAEYVQHIPTEITHCYGFRVEGNGKSVAFSGDTSPCDGLFNLAKDVDLLINDCSFPQVALDFRKKVGIGTAAHTSPTDLGKLAVDANVKSVIATHFGHFDTTNPVVKQY